MYPDTEKKLFLTFDGKATEYCIVINNDEAKRLQARLRTLFGDNEDKRGIDLTGPEPIYY